MLANLKKEINEILEKVDFEKLPDAHAWKISAMKDIVLVKAGHLVLEGFEEDEVNDILQYICTQ